MKSEYLVYNYDLKHKILNITVESILGLNPAGFFRFGARLLYLKNNLNFM